MDIEKLARFMTGQEIVDLNNASIARAVAELRAKGIQPVGRARTAGDTIADSLKAQDNPPDHRSSFKAA